MPASAAVLEVVPERCTGCKQCELACSFVQTGSFQPSRSQIVVQLFDEQASYAPYTCFQCDEAWCMQACPVNAIDVDAATGAKVVIDATCVGCGLCVIACPFGTMLFDAAAKKATKCDLCSGDPACAHACPTGAIVFRAPQQGTGAGGWIAAFSARVDLDFRAAQAEEGA